MKSLPRLPRSESEFTSKPTVNTPCLKLNSGSRVAVIGGGPAGSFFSYFLLDMAQQVGLGLQLDIYEPRDFSQPGPVGCNMCGGIISESLVQTLAVEGIQLPPTVVERGIDSYVLHTDLGSARINTPLSEKRIAAVHRGAGPLRVQGRKWLSFDGYLLELAQNKGAQLVRERVDDVEWRDSLPHVKTKDGSPVPYDLLAVAVGVNSSLPKLFERQGLGYQPPRTEQTYICEFYLGSQTIKNLLGSSMHIFLLHIPRLEFAALIPKGEYVTVCLLGSDIDGRLVQSFLDAPEVRACFPPGWNPPALFCHCSPRISTGDAVRPFADRLVFIGDAGVSKLYKDGIGSAYRTAKAAAVTAVFEGISAKEFRQHYWLTCQAISRDNRLGRLIFAVTRQIQKSRHDCRGLLRTITKEHQKEGQTRHLSIVLWDIFTGSAPYRESFLRTLHPFCFGRFAWEVVAGIVTGIRPFKAAETPKNEDGVKTGELGRMYRQGTIIIRQGEAGDCLYVIQAGEVEVLKEVRGKEVRLAVLKEGDFFGEMEIFDYEVRTFSFRALTDVRLLTVDKKMFLSRINEDPSLAFRMYSRSAPHS